MCFENCLFEFIHEVNKTVLNVRYVPGSVQEVERKGEESGEGGQEGNMQAGRSTLVTHLSPHLQHWFADWTELHAG